MGASATWPGRRAGMLALVLVCVVVGGCRFGELGGAGSTTRHGRVGQTLTDGGLRVTVAKVATRVPRRSGDVAGLSTPRRGKKFFGVKARACTDGDQAVKSYDFQLDRAAGGNLPPRLPETVYSNAFDFARSGCETGWILFELPRGDRAENVRFTYDDTGTARPGGKEKHARFSWAVGGG